MDGRERVRRPLSLLVGLLIIGELCRIPPASAQVLFFNDTESAFAKMKPWTADDDQISFSFRTRLRHGLLWSATSAGGESTMQLRLQDCNLLGFSGTQNSLTLHLLLLGPRSRQSLCDGRPHSVSLRREQSRQNAEDMILTVTIDSEPESSQSRVVEGAWYTHALPHDVFLAGLPESRAALKRFVGCIENYRSGNTTRPQPLVILASSAVSRTQSCPVCVDEETCLNDGLCAADGVSACRCAGTGHRGPVCGEGEASFRFKHKL